MNPFGALESGNLEHTVEIVNVYGLLSTLHV